MEELLDDGDDDSLGLGLGEKVYTGMQLSGETLNFLLLSYIEVTELQRTLAFQSALFT